MVRISGRVIVQPHMPNALRRLIRVIATAFAGCACAQGGGTIGQGFACDQHHFRRTPLPPVRPANRLHPQKHKGHAIKRGLCESIQNLTSSSQLQP
jgi:hypothetical protein